VKTFSHRCRDHIFQVCIALVVSAVASGCGLFRKESAPIDYNNYAAPGRAAGPAQHNVAPAPAAGNTNQPAQLLIAPTSVGKVESVNLQGRYVVVRFPIGQLPAIDSRMVVYRGDAKTGEVKISGPSLDNDLIAADIVLGTVQENDQVRSN
jgi:hypothetical protein